jgi:2'-5' RNA ligase
MKRTFISVRIKPSDEFVKAVSDLRSVLAGERIKWEDTGKLHVTLAFIGETSEGTIKDITAGLAGVCLRHKPFTFAVESMGLFKSIADPRVIWAGITRCVALNELQADTALMLSALGIGSEERIFSPHITVGRIKSVKDRINLREIIEKYKGVSFMEPLVNEVIYCESVLRPEGALHIPIKHIPVGSGLLKS